MKLKIQSPEFRAACEEIRVRWELAPGHEDSLVIRLRAAVQFVSREATSRLHKPIAQGNRLECLICGKSADIDTTEWSVTGSLIGRAKCGETR